MPVTVPRILAVPAFCLVVAACGDPPVAPVDGEMLGVPLGYRGGAVDLAWVPGTRLVAFRAPATDSTACGVRTLDVDSGRVRSLDDDCAALTSFASTALRGLAVATGGATIAWQVGLSGIGPAGGAVRAAAPGTAAGEVRRGSRQWPAVALSPDGRSLAYAWSLADTLVVRDLATGSEVAMGFGRPIAFSPDGLQLAYLVSPGGVRRRVLGDTVEFVVSVALQPGDELGPVSWSAGGLWAVVDRLNAGVRLRNADTGLEVLASSFEPGWRVRFPVWSADGRRMAFWEEYCPTTSVGTPCITELATLMVLERDTGRRVAIARGPAAGGPVALSPDGTEVVYGFGGALYRGPVPWP